METNPVISDPKTVGRVWSLLRITYGLYWGIIGIDKFFGLLTESEDRVSELTMILLPVDLVWFLRVVGVLEIAIALMILTKWPRMGAIGGVVFMGLIILNLIVMGEHFDIAVHGATIAIGMIGFIMLTKGR